MSNTGPITDEGKPGDYQIVKIGKMEIHKIPDVFVKLNIEIDKYHPKCQMAIATGPQGDWITKFPSVAAYCGYAMDDYYNAADFERIAGLCLDKLWEMRTGIILPMKD